MVNDMVSDQGSKVPVLVKIIQYSVALIFVLYESSTQNPPGSGTMQHEELERRVVQLETQLLQQQRQQQRQQICNKNAKIHQDVLMDLRVFVAGEGMVWGGWFFSSFCDRIWVE
jgi:hypothetical protein